MPSYTIANENIPADQLSRIYLYAKELYKLPKRSDLDLILNVSINNPDRFPSINITGQKNAQNYFNRWIKSYLDAINNPPSKRIANPKSSCTDPAIAVIVKATQGMTSSESTIGENTHNLFMSAENIQGNLLEEYIASKTRPYGFLWCAGNVLRAIDFCNTSGSLLLQIKNKSNTENSSSSNIREGTTIEKWYRLGTRTQGGIKYPDYKWNILNQLISNNRSEGFNLPQCNMTENDYEAFLTKVATNNKNLITNR